LALIRIHAS
jgi:hypothetical protein